MKMSGCVQICRSSNLTDHSRAAKKCHRLFYEILKSRQKWKAQNWSELLWDNVQSCLTHFGAWHPKCWRNWFLFCGLQEVGLESRSGDLETATQRKFQENPWMTTAEPANSNNWIPAMRFLAWRNKWCYQNFMRRHWWCHKYLATRGIRCKIYARAVLFNRVCCTPQGVPTILKNVPFWCTILMEWYSFLRERLRKIFPKCHEITTKHPYNYKYRCMLEIQKV